MEKLLTISLAEEENHPQRGDESFNPFTLSSLANDETTLLCSHNQTTQNLHNWDK